MNKEEFREFLQENFSLSGECRRIIDNILDWAEGMESDEQYNFLSELLSGIGLSDNEIKQIEY